MFRLKEEHVHTLRRKIGNDMIKDSREVSVA